MSKPYTPIDEFHEKLTELNFDAPFDGLVQISDAILAFDEIVTPILELLKSKDLWQMANKHSFNAFDEWIKSKLEKS